MTRTGIMNQSRTLPQGFPLLAVDKEDLTTWAVIGWVEPTVGARYPLLAPLGRDGDDNSPRLPAREGSQNRFEIDRYLPELNGVSVDKVLACGVSMNWLVDHGNRVSSGEVVPELEELLRPY